MNLKILKKTEQNLKQKLKIKQAFLRSLRIHKNLKAFLLGGLFCSILLSSCETEQPRLSSPEPQPEFYRAADLSFWPEIGAFNLPFYNRDSLPGNFLDILQLEGLNTVRIRLWVNPEDRRSSFAEVDSFAQIVKQRNLHLWLCIHLSDTWADPGYQITPSTWSTDDFPALKDSLYQYIYRVNQHFKPEILQIGNEINPGFLHPLGHRQNESTNFKSLLDTAVLAARNSYPESKIMMHFAGWDGATDFFRELGDLDYDMIGLSYYPKWHGKSLSALKNTFISLGMEFDKELMIAETAYPFTLGWNDWTHNVVGIESQLISRYPASPLGQKEFMMALREMMENIPQGVGFAYWGGEQVAWKGPQGENASSFENQAFFNFNQVALPVLEVYNP